MHPTIILAGYHKALQAALDQCKLISKKIDIKDKTEMRSLILSSVGTKFSARIGDLISDLALDAVLTVARDIGGRMEVDVKRYAKVEKIPGGELDDCRVLKGVMITG